MAREIQTCLLRIGLTRKNITEIKNRLTAGFFMQAYDNMALNTKLR